MSTCYGSARSVTCRAGRHFSALRCCRATQLWEPKTGELEPLEIGTEDGSGSVSWAEFWETIQGGAVFFSSKVLSHSKMMWKSSSDSYESYAWRRNTSCSDTAKCHAFETFGSRPGASPGVKCSFPQKRHQRCKIGSNSTSEMPSFTRFVALFAKSFHVIHQGSNPASGYSSWWVGSNHSSPGVGSWRISRWILLKHQKNCYIFGNGPTFSIVGATAAACNGWGSSWSWLLCAWQSR